MFTGCDDSADRPVDNDSNGSSEALADSFLGVLDTARSGGHSLVHNSASPRFRHRLHGVPRSHFCRRSEQAVHVSLLLGIFGRLRLNTSDVRRSAVVRKRTGKRGGFSERRPHFVTPPLHTALLSSYVEYSTNSIICICDYLH